MGLSFVTIDGRPGGMGTTKQLTISNTSSTAWRCASSMSRAITRSSSSRSGREHQRHSGTVLSALLREPMETTNNTIDTCDVRDGASTPTNGIYSLGTTTASAQNNSGNTVSNSNIFNFYSSTTASSGVRLDSGKHRLDDFRQQLLPNRYPRGN